MGKSLPLPVCALTSTTRRQRRRLKHHLSSLFEAMACGARGDRIEGTAYRHGSKLNGLARSYQFRDGDEDSVCRALQEPTVCALVRQRLRSLLSQTDIDLLHLRYCAGWSQAAVAEEWNCCRSTIKRREARILRRLIADGALWQAAVGGKAARALR